MVAGGEHCQLRAAIEVLVPYSQLDPVWIQSHCNRLCETVEAAAAYFVALARSSESRMISATDTRRCGGKRSPHDKQRDRAEK